MTVPIVLTTFCRPNLTRDSIVSLLTRFPTTTLIVTQDGRIPSYFEDEHKITREIIKELEIEYPQLRVNLRNRNVGLTGHLNEVFREVFQEFPNLIFLEEDMWIDTDGLKFLDEVKNDLSLSHRSAYSTTNHPITSNALDYRLSNFPEQWGVAINKAFYEAFQDEIQRKTVERNLVRRVVRDSGYAKIQAEILTDFWTQLLRQELDAPHGWDATFQLVLWRYSSPSKVSLKSFVKDLGGGEGSVTKRVKLIQDTEIQSEIHNNLNFKICLVCEQQDSLRRGYSPISQVRNRLRLRSRFLEHRALKQYL
jgi:hypothetical protein